MVLTFVVVVLFSEVFDTLARGGVAVMFVWLTMAVVEVVVVWLRAFLPAMVVDWFHEILLLLTLAAELLAWSSCAVVVVALALVEAFVFVPFE